MKRLLLFLSIGSLICSIPKDSHCEITPTTAQNIGSASYSNCGGIDWGNGITNWRNALSGKSVSLGPNDVTMYAEELTEWPSGKDHIESNADTSDITLLSSHGRYLFDGSTWPACESTHSCTVGNFGIGLSSLDFNPNGTCEAYLSEMQIGNDQTEYIDVMTCESSDVTMVSVLMNHTINLRQWHGFRGTSNTMVGSDTGKYINAAFSGAAAYAWLTKMTRWNAWNDGYDICAESLVRGDSNADVTSRINNEKYKDGIFWDSYNSSSGLLRYTSCRAHHVNVP